MSNTSETSTLSTTRLLVAYRTRPIAGNQPDVMQLDPPANYKNEDAIARWREQKAREMAGECLLQPYTAELDEVQLLATGLPAGAPPSDDPQPAKRKALPPAAKLFRWTYREPGEGRPPVCQAVRSWLERTFPGLWSNNLALHRDLARQVFFVGFDTRLFLDFLGVGCSLPASWSADEQGTLSPAPAPLNLWYGNVDHRDIAEAVYPSRYKFLTWPLVLKARGLDKMYANWRGPHQDPHQDIGLIAELAAQLGLLSD